MSRLFPSLAATFVFGAIPAAVAAGTPTPASDAIDPIIVTGGQPAYGVTTTASATRTPTDLKNIPQAMTIISGAQIRDQQLRSMSDLLVFVPGASSGSGEGNRDQLVLRGNSSTADFFVNGLRDDAQYFRDFYNVERVEILKGPDATIFGRGGGGGIVNRLLKRPTFANRQKLTASTDNWGAKRVTADLDETVSNALAFRVNGLDEDSDTFRHHVQVKRSGINPTLAILAGPDGRVDVGLEHFHDRRTADRGVPAAGGEPVRGFEGIFFGDPDISYSRANVDIVTLAVEQRFSDRLSLISKTQFNDTRKSYQNVFASSFDPATRLVALAGYTNLTNRRSLFSQTDLVSKLRLGGVDQTVVSGFELGVENSRNVRSTATFPEGNLVPIADPTADLLVDFAPVASDSDNRVEVNSAALYLQDQIRPATWLEIVAGLRFDALRIDVHDLRPVGGGLFGRTEHLWSPRLGIVLKPSLRLSIYGSYTRSYLPQSGDQFSGLTSVTEGLAPERFDNVELGLKLQLPGGLLATAAAYRLARTNSRAPDPSNPALTVLTGAQLSRGFELGLERTVTGSWLISGGYAFEVATITHTTATAPAGTRVPLVPRHSASLWNRYDFSRRIGVGIGVITRSRSYASISNAVTLPGYTRLDAALFARVERGLEAQLNIENLLGVHYFATANADNNIIPGAPRTLKATLGYRF